MTPRWPRKQVDGEMLCPSCVQAKGHVQSTAAADVLMARYAAGWSGEDIVRHELGRQKVHTVNDGPQLCPQHLRMRQSRADFATGLAAQVGLDRKFDAPSISPPHEGRCADCARVGTGTDLPWQPRSIPGAQPVHEERAPTRHIDTDEVYRPGRWPNRPHHPHERFAPVDTTIRSLNLRVAIALPGQRVQGIRVQAHDSGDGETIFHCPFCGSGQVIARSDGTVECEFCSTAFTVQVQPQMPAFPQTIDGVPVDVPGMPQGGQNANVPPGAAPDDPGAVSGPPGADSGDDSNPFADGADDGGEDDDSDDDSGNPFAKKSLRTGRGDLLTGEQYMRHLALVHSRHRQTVIAQIRHENGAR